MQLSITYIEMGHHTKAETMFYLAQQLNENCPLCYCNIGNSFFIRGNYERAISCWEKTKSIEPTHPQIDYFIGQAYWAKGDKNKAKEHFVAELRKNNSDTGVLLSYGLLLLEMDELQQAEGILGFVLELEPTNGYAHHYLGGLQLHKGNIDDAVKSFKKALGVKPTIEGAHYRLAQCYLQIGQSDKAKAHLLKEVKVCPANPDLSLDLGALLYEIGSTEEAIHCFLRSIDISLNDYRALHNLSCCNYWKGLIEDGIYFSLMALEQDPKHLPSLQNLIRAYLYNGELEKAQDYAEKAIGYWPNNKELKSLKRKIGLSKLVNKLNRHHSISGTNIAKRMRGTMCMEHSDIKWYPSNHIPSGKMERSENLNLFPPLMVRKPNWRV